MALSTFGAVMGFALKVVKHSMDTYAGCVDGLNDPAFRTTLQALLEEEKKNLALMEQARRENVTEMILEPITGLEEQRYEVGPVSPQGNDGDLLGLALALEENEYRFFGDASRKLPLPEVARIFRRVAQKKEKNIETLKDLKGIAHSLADDRHVG